ncbi:MAG: DUF373 family protein [Candidatus Verstraetearchaeota archaeon]|nr:DUF373 family protein [Candidatus Verstraetearchaeota archaeon]
MSLKGKRVLVLSVDKDDDVGSVTGIRTPVIGRENVSAVATQFAIRSPEDSDVNSIFAAINTYDSILSEGYECEVAVIAGSVEGGFKADLKISRELEEVLRYFNADGIVFVSDGAADEQVIPTIQSKVPILSVKRIFVQQQKSVEETYVLLYRYLKKLSEPQHSKLGLGVPGMVILLTVTLYFLNLINYAVITLGIVIGIILIIKGFHIDSTLKDVWSESPIRFITTVIGTIISSVALYQGISLALMDVALPEQLALFISRALSNVIDLLVVGVAIFLGGKLIVKYLEESPKLWHEVVGLVALIFIRQVVLDASLIIANPARDAMPIIISAGLGVFMCTLLAVVFTLPTRFRKKPEIQVTTRETSN